MSYLLPHLHSGFAVDQAILSVITQLCCGVFMMRLGTCLYAVLCRKNVCREGSCS